MMGRNINRQLEVPDYLILFWLEWCSLAHGDITCAARTEKYIKGMIQTLISLLITS